MGEDTPEGGPIGDPCEWCDDVLWPAGETPKYFKCIFSGIEGCFGWFPPAPNGAFILEQDDGHPCMWKYDDDDYYVVYTLASEWSQLSVQTIQGLQAWHYFYDRIEDICANGFTNANSDCNFPHCGKFGTAVVVPV